MEKRVRNKPHLVSVRLTSELYRRLEAACQIGPYRVSKAEIIERGLHLVLGDELEQTRKCYHAVCRENGELKLKLYQAELAAWDGS